MVKEVLSVRAESQIHALRQLEGLLQPHVHGDESRPDENISAKGSKAHVRRSAASGIPRIGKECAGSESNALGGTRTKIHSRRNSRLSATNLVVVGEDPVCWALPAIDGTKTRTDKNRMVI